MTIKPFFSGNSLKQFGTIFLLLLPVFAFPVGQGLEGCPGIQKTKWICDGSEYKVHPYESPENPYGFPDYNYFIESYNQKGWAQFRLLVLQVHTCFWDERRWAEFRNVEGYN